MPLSPGTASSGDVLAQLEKIVASSVFKRSQRMCRFLRFAVEQALAGAGDQIKEYLIGVEVFDRKHDYDPRVDPIVRVEARRLRAKLKAYYAAGASTTASSSSSPRAPISRRLARAGPPVRGAAADRFP